MYQQIQYQQRLLLKHNKRRTYKWRIVLRSGNENVFGYEGSIFEKNQCKRRVLKLNKT